jgi:hypothetical protein
MNKFFSDSAVQRECMYTEGSNHEVYSEMSELDTRN